MWSSFVSTLKEGLQEFSDQLKDDTEETRTELSNKLASAQETFNADTIRSKLAESNLTVERLSSIAQDTRRRVGDTLANASADGVMQNVEGFISKAEGTATALLSKAAAHPQIDRMLAGGGGSSSSATRPAAHAAEPPPTGSGGAQRLEERVRAMEADPQSFTAPPADRSAFGKWCAGFELLEHTQKIDELMKRADKAGLQQTQSSLVPSSMSYRAFWTRYFYELETLSLQEKKRLELLRRTADVKPKVEGREALLVGF